MPAVLRIKNEKGEIIAIPALRGDPGPEGPEGPAGPQGNPGDPGESAYDIAKAGGYKGSASDFYKALANISESGGGGTAIGSSIHIGPTEPTDEAYECWIDTFKSPALLKYKDANGIWQIISGGGGSTGGGDPSVEFVVTPEWTDTKIIAYGNPCKVNIVWSSLEYGNPTGGGTLKLYQYPSIDSNTPELKDVQSISQGTYELDYTNYLILGKNSFMVEIIDRLGNTYRFRPIVETRSYSIEPSFTTTSTTNHIVPYYYRANGSGLKHVTIKLMREEDVLVTYERDVYEDGALNTDCSFDMSSFGHGRYRISAEFVAPLTETDAIEVDPVYREFAYIEIGNTTPIITTDFSVENMMQYETQKVHVRVFTPLPDGSLAATTPVLQVYENQTGIVVEGNVAKESYYNVGNDLIREYLYKAENIGTNYIIFKAGDTKVALKVTVAENPINVTALTKGLILNLNAKNRNNDEPRDTIGSWTYEDNSDELNPIKVVGELSDFNFTPGSTNDGWVPDDEGTSMVLRVKGNARVFIPINIFNDEIKGIGRTIELEFRTRDVLDYDDILISCLDNAGIGFSITAQSATLYSSANYVSSSYKDDELVRLSFVIQPAGTTNLMCMYINGILSAVKQYTGSDVFTQTIPKGERAGIMIGSNLCTVDLYTIRVYKGDLSSRYVVDNWIADTQDPEEKSARFSRNNLYDSNLIAMDKLPEYLPYMIIEATEDGGEHQLPQTKSDEREFSGQFVDNVNRDRCFTFANAKMKVQGTSSVAYYRKNYDIDFSDNGIIKNGNLTYLFSIDDENSIPTDYFCLKADVASSEGANNVELVRLFNELCPVKTPPQLANPKVRQGIDGFPIVLFRKDNNGYTFLGKYNFNNSKETPEIFGMTAGVESWEVADNGSIYGAYRKDDFSDGSPWNEAFKARYPKKNKDCTNLAPMVKWVRSTCRDEATNESLGADGITLPYLVTIDEDGVYHVSKASTNYQYDTPEYRLAKFRSEVEEESSYFAPEHLQFFWLFTEFFAMIDNREKNTFPTRYLDGKWYVLPYDFDTALGINNVGALTFGFSVEDVDTEMAWNEEKQRYEEVYKFNGGDSVLWCNVRDAYADEIKTMYHNLRNGKLTYDYIISKFDEHQDVWGESVFNEDARFKYIDPLYDGKTEYLKMLHGSKKAQREFWLYNRFKYMDSKFETGMAVGNNVIDIRTNIPSPITIVPYCDMYASIEYDVGGPVAKERVEKDTPCELPFLKPDPKDCVTLIRSAADIAEIRGLEYTGTSKCWISAATKLKAIKIGADHINTAFNEFNCGNNYLLTSVDLRNCPNLTHPINLIKCTSIEEVYLQGTGVQECKLPIGGNCKTLLLPDSTTNLMVINHRLEKFQLNPVNLKSLSLQFREGEDIMKKTLNVRELLTTLLNNAKSGGYKATLRLWNFVIGSTDENDANSFNTLEEVLELYQNIRDYSYYQSSPDEEGKTTEDISRLPELYGDIYVKQDTVSGTTLAACLAIYPTTSIRLHYNTIEATVHYYVDYADKGRQLLWTPDEPGTCLKGETLSFHNPAYDSVPTKYSNGDTENDTTRYVFIGWDVLLPNGELIRYDDEQRLSQIGIRFTNTEVQGVTENMTFIAHFREDTKYYRSFVDSRVAEHTSDISIGDYPAIKVSGKATNVYYALEGEDNVLEPNINPSTPRHKNVMLNGNLHNLYLNGWIDIDNQGSGRYTDKENSRYVVPNISEGDSTNVVYITSYEAKRLYSVYFHVIDPVTLSNIVLDQVNYEAGKPITNTTKTVSSYYDTNNVYSFDRWVDENDKAVDFSTMSMGTKDIHVYASYSAEVIKYTVRFIVDGAVIQMYSDKVYSTSYDTELYTGPTSWTRTSPNQKTMSLQRWVVRNRLVNDIFYLDYIARLSIEEYAILNLSNYSTGNDSSPEGRPQNTFDNNDNTGYSLDRRVSTVSRFLSLFYAYVRLETGFTSLTRNSLIKQVTIESKIGRQGYQDTLKYPCEYRTETLYKYKAYNEEDKKYYVTNSSNISSVKHENNTYNTTEAELAIQRVTHRYNCDQTVVSWLNQNVQYLVLPESDNSMRRFCIYCTGYCVYLYEVDVILYYESEVDLPEYN